MFWELILTGGGIAICYFFVSRFKRIRAKILISFLVFGLLMGSFSFWLGDADSVVYINPPGSKISEIVYNKYLIPYWERTLEPVYEEIPAIGVGLPPGASPESPEPGTQVGIKTGPPLYDVPLKKISDLFIPVTLLFWGFIGLMVQLIYNTRRRSKSLPQ